MITNINANNEMKYFFNVDVISTWILYFQPHLNSVSCHSYVEALRIKKK